MLVQQGRTRTSQPSRNYDTKILTTAGSRNYLPVHVGKPGDNQGGLPGVGGNFARSQRDVVWGEMYTPLGIGRTVYWGREIKWFEFD